MQKRRFIQNDGTKWRRIIRLRLTEDEPTINYLPDYGQVSFSFKML